MGLGSTTGQVNGKSQSWGKVLAHIWVSATRKGMSVQQFSLGQGVKIRG